jgi:DNA polymerase-3 subunit alpha
VRTLEQARLDLAEHIHPVLDLSDPKAHERGQALIAELGPVLDTFKGRGLPVHVQYHRPGAWGRLVLGSDWRMHPTDELLKRLRQLLGQQAVRISYERDSASAATPHGASAPPRLALVK